jgi:glycyl-tRNA synthetase beta subunit
MTKSPTILLNAIIETAPDLAKFFENVLVMDENIKVRQNRINLLTNIKKIISRFINLTEI